MQQIFGYVFVDFSVKQTSRQAHAACGYPLLFIFTSNFLLSMCLMLSNQVPAGIRGTLCRRSYSRKFFWDSC